MAKKVQYTTNQPSSSTDYLAADNTWKPYSGGGGSSTWGSITGTLSSQTDLQTALNAKVNLEDINPICKLATNISKGQAVYVSSANGTNMIISKASNSAESTSSKTFGLLSATGVTNDQIRVITNGFLSGLDTSAATIGDAVWLGTSGNLLFGLASKPVAPAHLVFIGLVTRVHAVNGEIFVKVQNGFELDELHDVLVGSYGTKDVLWRDTATNLWKNKDVFTLIGSASSSTNGYLTSTDWSIFNGKQDTITGAATSIVSSNLTNYRALVSDGGGKVAVSGVTGTELGYLSGVTSNVQSQLDAKASVSRSFLAVNQNATVIASTTTYGSFIYSGLGTELARIFVVPYACTMKNFYVRLFAAQPGTGSLVMTLRKNQADTAVVVTIAAGSAANTEANSGSTSATFAAGDDCSIKFVNNALGVSGTINNTSIMVEI